MKKFSEFNITISTSTFIGDKIKISKILNRQITVHAYKIEASKHFKNERLDLQIEVNGTKHICFTGSTKLLEQIQQVPQSRFPFETTIVEDNDMYLFT